MATSPDPKTTVNAPKNNLPDHPRMRGPLGALRRFVSVTGGDVTLDRVIVSWA
ncbi:hypothetical protein [Amycolatopsis pithecellobii]|uniref:Uncharacterized protein n=1 Tax=Amycolatopsis pithecellobii TaxID=664692 RepID=A0A6N7YU61_9PSEU|nr:hypothetical protein [Amycolatopsis pithecellobii]MTD52383.1 hypothetical protein [Amycolatopsis pithecellobii]